MAEENKETMEKERALLVPKEKPAIYALDVSGGVKPHNYEELASFAKLYLESGLAPKSFGTWQQVMIAAAMCLEVGRPIATGLQDMAVINNRVGIFGDAALAVIRGTGLLQEFKEWSEGTPYTDDWTFYCKVVRKGEAPCKHNCEPGVCKDPLHCANMGTWTWLESKRAGFDDPKMRDGSKDPYSPWRRFTKRMMQFKARNFIIRDKFGDVLKGITTVEDLQDAMEEPINVTPPEKQLADKKATVAYEIKEAPIQTTEPVQTVTTASGQPKAGMVADITETGIPFQRVEMPEDAIKPPPPGAPPNGKVEEGPSTPPPMGKPVNGSKPEEAPLYKLLKGMRPGKGAQALQDFTKLVRDNIAIIETWPESHKELIKSKWEDRVGAPWPTNVIERPPEVPPEPEKKEPEKPPEKPDVVWEIEGEEAPFQAGGTKEEEPPSEYDQLCATLSGPTQVAKDAIERLSIVTNFDKDIQDRVSGTETNLPLGPKTFLEFLVELSTIVKGKYKNAGDFKVAIVKYEAQDLAWSAYLEWVLKKFSG